MRKLTVNIPEDLDLDPSHAEFLLAIKLYETGNLNCNQAADMIDVTADDFMEILENFKSSIMKQRLQNLRNDIQNL